MKTLKIITLLIISFIFISCSTQKNINVYDDIYYTNNNEYKDTTDQIIKLSEYKGYKMYEDSPYIHYEIAYGVFVPNYYNLWLDYMVTSPFYRFNWSFYWHSYPIYGYYHYPWWSRHWYYGYRSHYNLFSPFVSHYYGPRNSTGTTIPQTNRYDRPETKRRQPETTKGIRSRQIQPSREISRDRTPTRSPSINRSNVSQPSRNTSPPGGSRQTSSSGRGSTNRNR